MPYLNDCTMMGNLSRNPDLRYTPSGSPVCEMTIAVNRRSKDREEVCFLDVVAWGKTAENCSRYLAKGSCLLVKGYLKQDTWEDRNGGGKRSKLRIVAESIQFITTPKNTETRATGPVPAEYAPPPSQHQPEEHDQAKSNGYQPHDDPPPSGPGEAKPGDSGYDDDIPF